MNLKRHILQCPKILFAGAPTIAGKWTNGDLAKEAIESRRVP